MPETLQIPSHISHDYLPSLELRQFVHILLSEEVKGNKAEAARRTGCDVGRFYYAFRMSPEFRAWFSEQCDLFLGKNEAIPAYSLLNQIVKGDVQAIRAYYELRGKLKHGEAGAAGQAVGVRVMVQIVNGVPEGTNGHTIPSAAGRIDQPDTRLEREASGLLGQSG